MKNAFLKWLCKVLPIPKHKGNNRFLLVSTTALGDTLWATPTIFSLRKSFPKSYICVLTSVVGQEVLKNNPYVDKIFVLKEPLLPRFFSLWKTLYQEEFSTILILHASQRLTLPLCSLLGATRMIGTCGINKGLDSLLTDSLEPSYEHEILRRLRMVEKVGGEIHTETLQFFPSKVYSHQPGTWNLERSKSKLQSDGSIDPLLPPGKWIAIHPGSKDGFKRWPARNFVKVGKELQSLGYKILLTGISAERPLLEEISQELPHSVIDETSSLHIFAKKLSSTQLLISNDTGPVHLACALGTPVIALYGATDPSLCGPHLFKKGIALQKPPTCTPCLKRKCRTPFCLLQISPKEVLSAVSQLTDS